MSVRSVGQTVRAGGTHRPDGSLPERDRRPGRAPAAVV